ncbi:hypothetical protein ACJ6WF_31195 [Streptomyces sp. MMS24-I2-30]|uniref:SbtR family transcriptional regulator n=1 Tax=Streptomyces sp. MMS24-I2-30 TaxID=3351564 RepID=UPI0038969C7C
MPPHEALRAWTRGFLDHAGLRPGMADALRTVVVFGVRPCASRELLVTALTSLVAAATADGTVRPDTRPTDLLAALVGVALGAGDPARREQAERLLALVLGGCAAEQG